MAYLHSGTLNDKKRNNTDECDNKDESQMQYANRSYIVYDYCYMTLEMAELVARGWSQEEG